MFGAGEGQEGPFLPIINYSHQPSLQANQTPSVWDWPTASVPLAAWWSLPPFSTQFKSHLLFRAASPSSRTHFPLAVPQRSDSPLLGPVCTLSVSCTSLCPWHSGQWAPTACLFCADFCSPVKTGEQGQGGRRAGREPGDPAVSLSGGMTLGGSMDLPVPHL